MTAAGLRSTGRAAVRAATVLAGAGAVHATLNARLLRRPAPAPAHREPGTVAVLVPARDEAGRIGPCVRALLGQDGVGEVVVLDDCSRDATAGEARSAGARVLPGTPPPAGWLGKPWACAQLAAASPDDVLVYVDADVLVAPGGVRAALELLETSGLDVACPVPRQLAEGPAERLVQPLLSWSYLTMLPLRVAERSPRPSLTAAVGQFLLVRRAALDAAGGFGTVRNEVLDDLALVRAVKAAGGRGGVVDGSRLATCRMYDGWPAVREGYAKSLWSAFGSPGGACAVAAGLGWVYVVPAVAALAGSRAGLLGYAAGVTSRVVAARATGGRAWPDALAHPASVAAFAALVTRSVRGRRRGELAWKGRPVGAAPSRPADQRG